MTRHVGALADRLLAMVLPKTTASAVCNPGCGQVPMCCRYTTTKFKWRTGGGPSCAGWWGDWC
ncbi:hypothetical protein K1W54_06600 [Micromonospora sp. CPCC 205371]|nr:hypothetical protein [Micromonospora sp. CPCC 205371]